MSNSAMNQLSSEQREQANTFFMIAQRRVLKATEECATTMRRWSQRNGVEDTLRD